MHRGSLCASVRNKRDLGEIFYKVDQIRLRTCQWSMKMKSQFSIRTKIQNACKHSEGKPGNGKGDSAV